MRTPLTYFILGGLFTYFAYISLTDTMWNMTTILLLLLAALEFTIGCKILMLNVRKNKESKKD